MGDYQAVRRKPGGAFWMEQDAEDVLFVLMDGVCCHPWIHAPTMAIMSFVIFVHNRKRTKVEPRAKTRSSQSLTQCPWDQQFMYTLKFNNSPLR